jgi:hypothetical protein
MMKKVVTLFAIIIALAGLTIVAGATATTPGSSDDPVVTKSYVDRQIAQLQKGGASQTYEPVHLNAGQKIIGHEGSELILRSGEATAIDNGANGVSDITGAKDLMTGHSVEQNHLLLIPRTDGRGIKATTEIWVMIRGSYEIQ